jgi:hypothetical protein
MSYKLTTACRIFPTCHGIRQLMHVPQPIAPWHDAPLLISPTGNIYKLPGKTRQTAVVLKPSQIARPVSFAFYFIQQYPKYRLLSVSSK